MSAAGFTAQRQKEFIFELVVTQGDITPYGSASFINYVRWYGIARDALLQWRNLGFEDALKSSVETEVAFCNLHYKREARLQDEIRVKVNSSHINRKDFTLLFTLIRKDNALLISLGKQRLSFCDSGTGEAMDLPRPLVDEVLRPIEVDEKALLFQY